MSRGDFVSFKLFKKLVPLFNVFLRDDEKAMQKFLPVTGLVFRYLKANHVDFSLTSPVLCLHVPHMPAFCIEYTSSPTNSTTHAKGTKLRLLSVLHIHLIFFAVRRRTEQELCAKHKSNEKSLEGLFLMLSLCRAHTGEPPPGRDRSGTCVPVTVLLCWSHCRLWGWCLFISVLCLEFSRLSGGHTICLFIVYMV